MPHILCLLPQIYISGEDTVREGDPSWEENKTGAAEAFL